MITATLKMSLKLRGPVLTRASGPMDWGVDAAWPRSADNKARLPGSLVYGKLREGLLELADAAPTAFDPPLTSNFVFDLFGDTSSRRETDGANKPYRRRLQFGDFEGPVVKDAGHRHRVAIDARTGAARRHHLVTIESPFASGKEVGFEGRADLLAADEGEATRIANLIQTGLQWLTQIGAQRTVGFGELLEASVAVEQVSGFTAPAEKKVPELAATGRLHLKFEIKQPFCLSQPRIIENLFESADIIPGAAIKGCVAERWRRLRGLPPGPSVAQPPDPARLELSEWFDRLRFSHCFPAPEGQGSRPVVPPLALAQTPWKPPGQTTKAKPWCDLSLVPQPCLVEDKAPKYRFDWKEKDLREVDGKVFGWAFPVRTLRVRTAMDAEKRTARDQHLFALELVRPNKTEWHGWVDFGCIPDVAVREKVAQQLWELLTPFSGLGKTKASARVRTVRADTAFKLPSRLEPTGDMWVVTLQTATLLADPSRLAGPIPLDAARIAYSEAWHELSGGVLKLSHFLARQTLAGGGYLWRRFQNGSAYQPWLLTMAGSVFALQATGDITQAKECIERWLVLGLPLPKWACERFGLSGRLGEDWSRCPYVPENGYGEIAVNLKTDQAPPPPEEIKIEPPTYA